MTCPCPVLLYYRRHYSIEAACCFMMRVVRLAVEIAGHIPLIFFYFALSMSYIQKSLMTQ